MNNPQEKNEKTNYRPDQADIRQRREQLALTQVQIARAAGCSVKTVQHIEAGVTRRGITREKISRLLTQMELEDNAA